MNAFLVLAWHEYYLWKFVGHLRSLPLAPAGGELRFALNYLLTWIATNSPVNYREWFLYLRDMNIIYGHLRAFYGNSRFIFLTWIVTNSPINYHEAFLVLAWREYYLWPFAGHLWSFALNYYWHELSRIVP